MIEEKYIELLLKRCLRLEECEALFLNYNKINKDFAMKVVDYAKSLGIKDIYLDEEDSNYIHELLLSIKKDDIEKNDAFNSSIWDEYAKKNTAFLMLDTEIPNLMDDINSELLALSAYTKRKTKPLYKEKQMNSEIPWCIAAVPNIYWAKEIFTDSANPLEEFWQVLSKMCMLDKEDPVSSWNNQLNEQNNLVTKLNELKIKKLYYKNSLGTDLVVELSDKAIWASASSGKWIVNMPSYEVFTTPDYHKTEGIVYSSKPLIYNGKVINEFSITFKNGKAYKIEAKEGEDILKEIINGDELSSYLGEVALVNYDSPISNTNKIFKSTLFDENASCHLALGNGFIECVKDGEQLNEKEQDKIGLNSSKNHVDFMIGTNDLLIEADTIKGRITIIKDGNLTI